MSSSAQPEAASSAQMGAVFDSMPIALIRYVAEILRPGTYIHTKNQYTSLQLCEGELEKVPLLTRPITSHPLYAEKRRAPLVAACEAAGIKVSSGETICSMVIALVEGARPKPPAPWLASRYGGDPLPDLPESYTAKSYRAVIKVALKAACEAIEVTRNSRDAQSRAVVRLDAPDPAELQKIGVTLCQHFRALAAAWDSLAPAAPAAPKVIVGARILVDAGAGSVAVPMLTGDQPSYQHFVTRLQKMASHCLDKLGAAARLQYLCRDAAGALQPQQSLQPQQWQSVGAEVAAGFLLRTVHDFLPCDAGSIAGSDADSFADAGEYAQDAVLYGFNPYYAFFYSHREFMASRYAGAAAEEHFEAAAAEAAQTDPAAPEGAKEKSYDWSILQILRAGDPGLLDLFARMNGAEKEVAGSPAWLAEDIPAQMRTVI